MNKWSTLHEAIGRMAVSQYTYLILLSIVISTHTLSHIQLYSCVQLIIIHNDYIHLIANHVFTAAVVRVRFFLCERFSAFGERCVTKRVHTILLREIDLIEISAEWLWAFCDCTIWFSWWYSNSCEEQSREKGEREHMINEANDGNVLNYTHTQRQKKT